MTFFYTKIKNLLLIFCKMHAACLMLHFNLNEKKKTEGDNKNNISTACLSKAFYCVDDFIDFISTGRNFRFSTSPRCFVTVYIWKICSSVRPILIRARDSQQNKPFFLFLSLVGAGLILIFITSRTAAVAAMLIHGNSLFAHSRHTHRNEKRRRHYLRAWMEKAFYCWIMMPAARWETGQENSSSCRNAFNI